MAALLSFICGSMFADVVKFAPAEFEAATSADYSLTKNGVTVAVSASTVTADQFRIFKGQTATITSTADPITLVQFTCTANGSEKYGPGNLDAADTGNDSGEYIEEQGPHYWWYGSTAELKLTAVDNQVRATEIVVYTGKDGEKALSELPANQIGYVYMINFTEGQGDFTVNDVKLGEGLTYVWKQDNSYGMKASAYANKQNIESESWLISPVIDLAGVTQAEAGFTQVINKYFGDVTQEATVWVREEGGEWKQVQITYPALSGSTFSEDAAFAFSLQEYDGKKVQVGFKYTSTNEHAGTWEIFDFYVAGIGGQTEPVIEPQIESKTVAEALAIIDALEDGKTTTEEYQVTGFVVGAPDFQRKADGTLYGNVNLTIADEKGGTALLTVYRGKNLNNESFTEETISSIKEGDEVVFQGKLQKFVKNDVVTPELTNGFLISVTSGEEPVSNARVWDFTNWSSATIDNLLADAAADIFTGWSDVEKDPSGTDKNGNPNPQVPTETSKDNCFWYQASTNADGTLSANGKVIEELKGLVWNETYTKKRSLAIAVNYPKALSDYFGPAYLWLGGGKNKIPCFTIPNVIAGSTITMEVESHKTSEGRGIELYSGLDAEGLVDAATKIGDSFTPKELDTHTWTVDKDCDVIVYNTNGCHIYTIKVEAGEVAPKPILTLKGAVGAEVTMAIGVYDSEDTYSVDFGNGELQTAKVGIENKGPVQEDGTTPTATTFKGTIAGDGTIKVYGNNDIWYLTVSGDAMPTTFDQPKLKNVAQMSISGANAESVALPALEKLTQFSFTNSPAKSVDVSKVPTLTSLSIFNTTQSAFEPQLESIDVSKNVNLEMLVLGGNTYQKGKLTALDVTSNTKLTQISAENNKIASLTGLPVSLKNLYVSNNELASLTFPEFTTKGTIQVQNNKFTLATLPTKPAITSTSKYTYAPQPAYQVAETVGVLDLTSLLTATGVADGPKQTTYSFVTASGTELVEGTDYAVLEAGKFAFFKEQTEKVHGVMATDAFPKFTGKNAYVTTEFAVDAAEGLASITGISIQQQATQLYNLKGQKVMKPTKGLYIQKGKKVVMK